MRAGLPHSEIRGSTGARPSPRLFAACHVLHRLSVPRHPPNALTLALDPSTNPRNARTARRDQHPASPDGTPIPAARLRTQHSTTTPRPNPNFKARATARPLKAGDRPGSQRQTSSPCPRPAGLPANPLKPCSRRCLGPSASVRPSRPVPVLWNSHCRIPTVNDPPRGRPGAALVEAIGLEPTTSCLQSTRSPS